MTSGATARIPVLFRGAIVDYAIVDAPDAHLVSGLRWSRQSHGYAATGSERRYMHRVVLGLTPGDRREVDHLNGNGLDNRRLNLRVVDHAVNTQNVHTPCRGAHLHNQTGRYRATVTVGHRRYSLGLHDTIEQAMRAAAEGRARLMPGSLEYLARTSGEAAR